MVRIRPLVGIYSVILQCLVGATPAAVVADEVAAAASTEQYDVDEVWNTWMLPEIRGDYLKCYERYHSRPAPVHSPATWSLLRNKYHSVVLSNPETTTREFPMDDDSSGFAVEVETKQTPEKGRGNYAAGQEGIPKDSLIWKSTYTAEFREGDSFRTFLRRLPPSLACDVMIWAYTRQAPDGTMVACVDLDPGSFTNSANLDEELNMALLSNHPWNTGCDLEFYATRDIPVGEELAIDYSFSAGDRGWVAMGLSSWEVLGYPDDDEEEEEDWEEEDWEEEKSEEVEL